MSVLFKKAWFIPKSGSLKSYYNGETLSASNTHDHSTGYFTIYQDGDRLGGSLYVDYVFIRKYVSPEPVVSVGSEEVGQ
jgi:hypothetical protein